MKAKVRMKAPPKAPLEEHISNWQLFRQSVKGIGEGVMLSLKGTANISAVPAYHAFKVAENIVNGAESVYKKKKVRAGAEFGAANNHTKQIFSTFGTGVVQYGESLEKVLSNIPGLIRGGGWNWARDYRSETKVSFDKYAEPIATAALLNAGYVIGIDNGLDWVNNNLEGTTAAAATLGTYATVIPFAVFANRKGIVPAAKKLFEHYKKKQQEGKKATLLSYVRTAALVGAGYAAFAPVQQAVENIKYDAVAIVDARQSRESVPPPSLEARLETIEEPQQVMEQYPDDEVGLYTTGALEGRVLGGFFTELTGIKGKVPEKVNVNLGYQMDQMWVKKLADGRGPEIAIFKEQVMKFINSGKIIRMTADEYIQNIADSMATVDRDLDWNKVRDVTKLETTNQINLVRQVTYMIEPQDLMAISMTELMPSTDGKLNLAVYDFLLRTGGRTYIELIPAQGDNWGSFGSYQHTSHVVRHDAKNMGAASRIATALRMNSEARLPGSMYLLSGNDHHHAAYQNAIFNLATMVRTLSRSQSGKLSQHYLEHRDDIAKIVQLGHHQPRAAITTVKRWLDDEMKKPVFSYADKRFLPYIERLEANNKVFR